MADWLVLVLFFYTIRAIFLSLTIPPAITAYPLSFNYSGFKEDDVKLEGEAFVSESNIDINVDSEVLLDYSAGRVTSSRQLHLWDRTSRNLTGFSTNFSFIMRSPFIDETVNGMAFFLADPNLPVLNKIKEGGGLGLVDGDQVLNSIHHSFVAVEFDTYQNYWDPNFTHMGMNFNSMNSSITVPWSYDNSDFYDCNIDYNSTTHNLSISCTTYDNGQTTQYLSHKVDLREHLPQWVIVGFSAATRNIFQDRTLQSWSFTSSLDLDNEIPTTTPNTTPNPQIRLARERKVGLLLGIGVGICLAVSSLGLVWFLLWKCKKTEGNEEESVCGQNMDDEFQKGSGPKKIRHDELIIATNNFSEAEKLGHGGFGGVYKGFLKDLNSHVAIKKISTESKQGIKEYATEVKIISQLRHRNLVQLIGWCHKKKDLLLIYEYMPNGSLDSHLYHGKGFLTWHVRYNITLDLASALLYLHEEWKQCVLHRDIKSSNIMLDSSFKAKLGDFGLARLVDHEKGSQTTVIAGTPGYIAPEYFTRGKVGKESDIYSFGVVVLEIASGRKPFDLKAEDEIPIVEWVWELYGLGQFLEVADPKLHGEFDEQEMKRLVIVGIWCVQPDPSSRPTARQVIQVLNFEAPLPDLPKKMPVPTYHPRKINVVFS